MSDQQRLSDRLTKYWETLRKDEVMPPFQQFNVSTIEDLWGNCVLLSVNKSNEETKTFVFYRVGDRVKELYNEDLTGISLKSKQKMIKGAAIIKRIDEIIANPAPVYDSGQFVSERNKVVKFRSCLLPFGTGGEVTHVIAGLSWREF